ncbi:MAG: hypothetical protein ABJ004_19975 [Cyclobacteriaceae bacterium]
MAKEFGRAESNYKIKKDRRQLLSEYGQNRSRLSEEVIYRLFKDFKYLIPQGSVMSSWAILMWSVRFPTA